MTPTGQYLNATSHDLESLPDWHELFAACCGHIGDQPEDHPITRCAHTLAEVHLALTTLCRNRIGCGAAFAQMVCARVELVAAINTWVAMSLPPREPSPHPTSISLGSVVDRMAAAQVTANQALRKAGNASDQRVRDAWYRLALLAETWTDSAKSVERSCMYLEHLERT